MITIIISISLLLGILGTVTLFLLLGILDKKQQPPNTPRENSIPYSCPYRQIIDQEPLQNPHICPYWSQEDTIQS